MTWNNCEVDPKDPNEIIINVYNTPKSLVFDEDREENKINCLRDYNSQSEETKITKLHAPNFIRNFLDIDFNENHERNDFLYIKAKRLMKNQRRYSNLSNILKLRNDLNSKKSSIVSKAFFQ